MKGLIIFFTLLLFAGCKETKSRIIVEEEVQHGLNISSIGRDRLSVYGFFKMPLRNLDPTDDVIPYQLNAPLFSDYAFKKRFVKIPKGKQAVYNENEVFDFPDGTVLIKNFYYPEDFRQPEKKLTIIETRLLIKEERGWKALPYVWNKEQTEAYLEVTGKTLPVSWTHDDGATKLINYSVPNMNQCKSCHMKGDQLVPLGPSARQLNGMKEKSEINQLTFLRDNQKLLGLPEDFKRIPKLVSYNDKNASINNRARSWLDVNCAHCHRLDGPAKTSGLHLSVNVTNLLELGIGKAPVAAGKGSGGLLYDIVPGKPEKSILFYRINSVDPGVMMPELGRTIIHQEGVELIRNWIASMK